MNLEFSPEAWEQYRYHTEEGTLPEKVNQLLKDIRRNPFRGIGKPEPLKGNLAGYWSRRINRKHRIVYRIYTEGDTQRCYVLTCRFHYQ